MATADIPDLRSLRLARRLSVAEAAARAGVSRSALAAWESGTNRPRGPALARLLDVLGTEPRLRARLVYALDPAFARVDLAHSALGAPVDVGMVVRAMRQRRKATQTDLARAVGVTQSAVAHWEAGDAVPPPETLHAVGFALRASAEETLALASAAGEGGAGLPDDPEATLDHLACLDHAPAALWEIVSLGCEAELWRRAVRDPRWDAPLVRVLADRANWLVSQERWDEVALPARRAVGMAKTTEERALAVPALAALADLERHRGAGHAEAAERAGECAKGLPDSPFRAWALYQQGLSLARLRSVALGSALVAQATEIQERFNPWERFHSWSYHTAAQCEVYLAAGEPVRAAALVGGRRERLFDGFTYVRVQHANGRAASGAEIAALRHMVAGPAGNPRLRRRLERIERRQAKLTGQVPEPAAPQPAGSETDDRLWAAILREHRG